MGTMEKSGIVDFGDIFKLQQEELDFEREDDILPSKRKQAESSVAKPEEEELEQEDGDPSEENDKDTSKPEKEDHVVIDYGLTNEKYHKIISDLCKRGVLSDLKDVKFESEDGKELALDELELKDEESFVNLISSILANQKEAMLQDKIDVGSISDFTKKLIQADKAGANVLDILKQYDKMSAPVEQLNMDDKKDQLKVISHYISLLGLPKDEADEFYKGIVEKGDDYIEAKALKYKSELDKKMSEIIEERTKEAERKRKEDAENFKLYKKALKTAFQNQYQLTDAMVAKAMDFVLKPSKSNPNFSEANERVRQMLMSPELAPDLIMFLMDPEEFIKQKSNRKVSEEKKRIYKLISSSKKDRSVAPVDDKGDEVRGMPLEEIRLKE